MRLMNICGVEPLEKFTVRVRFDDGVEKTVNLEPYLRGPIFAEIRGNMDLFRSVRVDEQAGTIVWPNGADIDPNVLYYDDLKPAWMEEQSAQVVQQT